MEIPKNYIGVDVQKSLATPDLGCSAQAVICEVFSESGRKYYCIMVKPSDTSGVKPMAIAGRLVRERERLLGMTDAERAFRAQWLKDQILTAREPVHVPELFNFQYNWFRRLYKVPLQKFEDALVPKVGVENAFKIRFLVGKIGMFIGIAYWFTYYFKYNTNDWTRHGGLMVASSRKAVLPGDPGYPFVSERTKASDYGDRGFKACADMKL